MLSLAPEARKRAKDLRRGGKCIDADDLEALCDGADAALRLWSMSSHSWESTKADWLSIANSPWYDLVPWELKLLLTRRLLEQSVATKKYQQWSLRLWTSPACRGPDPPEGGRRWSLDNARMSALLSDMLDSQDTKSEDYERFSQVLEEELMGDHLFALVSIVDQQQAVPGELQDLLRSIVDLASAAPPDERVLAKVHSLQRVCICSLCTSRLGCPMPRDAPRRRQASSHNCNVSCFGSVAFQNVVCGWQGNLPVGSLRHSFYRFRFPSSTSASRCFVGSAVWLTLSPSSSAAPSARTSISCFLLALGKVMEKSPK